MFRSLHVDFEQTTWVCEWIVIRCAEKRLQCDACTLACARQMESYRGSHRCNVTADDADEGRSPRLRYCLACCQMDECSRVCSQVYASRECRRVRYVFEHRHMKRIVSLAWWLQNTRKSYGIFINVHERIISVFFLLAVFCCLHVVATVL